MKHRADKTPFLRFYIASLALFLILAVSGFYFGGKWLISNRTSSKGEPAKVLEFVNLPHMTVSVGNQASMQMEMNVSLEVERKDVPILEGYIPQIVDKFNAYFPEVNVDELHGPFAMHNLHKNMLWLVNSVGMPVYVYDLMLKDLVII
jgi:hypothetical protein